MWLSRRRFHASRHFPLLNSAHGTLQPYLTVYLLSPSRCHCRDNLWCNGSVLQLGVEREARGRVKYSSSGTPRLDFRSLLLLVGGSWRAAVTCLAECALSFKRLTSPRHWWDGVRHVLNSLKTIIILRPSWRLRLVPFILFQNFCCQTVDSWSYWMLNQMYVCCYRCEIYWCIIAVTPTAHGPVFGKWIPLECFHLSSFVFHCNYYYLCFFLNWSQVLWLLHLLCHSALVHLGRTSFTWHGDLEKCPQIYYILIY